MLSAGCATLGAYSQTPRVSLNDVRPLDMTLFEQRYLLTLRIQNPNEADLPIRGMSYTVYINDTKFADGVSPQAVTVSAFGERVVEVEAVSNLLRVIEQFRHRDGGSRGKLNWRITGGLSLENRLGGPPLEYEGELDLTPRDGEGQRI